MTEQIPSLPDQTERDRILGVVPDDLGCSFAVEAGAGSGKTTALIGRLLALVEAGATHLPGGLRTVVAITFTRKAAAELRAQAYRRFVARAATLSAALQEATSESAPTDVALRLRRVREALAELDAACIDTIHGFCGRLLRADALAAGLPPDFSVIEDREADDLRRAFWRRYVRARHEEVSVVTATASASLNDVGLRPDEVEPLFAALIRHADRLPVPYGARCPELGPAVATGIERLEAWQAFRPDPPLGSRDGLQQALDTAERLLHMRGVDTPLDQARFLGALMEGYKERSDQGAVTLNRWSERGSPRYDRAKALRDDEVPALAARVRPLLRDWEAYVYDAALAYARDAVDAFAAERRRGGTLTFDDVLQATATLLRRSPAARRRAAARHRRFFVDEFQDTDPVQAEVLFLLTATNLDETDWRRCRPRPGSLFLVGDPKQSIYRFRRADIETYDEARRLLGAEAQLQLTSCFRSLPRLCAWVNDQLRPPFSDDRGQEGGTRRQATYVDLQSARPDGPVNRCAAPAVARIDIDKVYGNYADSIAEVDAESVATFIRAAVDGHADPALYKQPGDRARPEAFGDDTGTVFGAEAHYGDFLVLCRAASRFALYATVFERLGIPYALAGDKGLGGADELRALVDLLDAVRDPLDEVARAAHRTGLLGGLDAPTLYGLHVETLDGDGARARAAEAADAEIAAARRTLETLPLAAAIERIVSQSGLVAWAARRPGGSDRAGGLLKIVALARGWEAKGLHWTEALDHLRDLQDGAVKDGRITLEEGTRDAVRIMTVHQAKGLQAPVVFLADPYSGFDPEPSEHAGRDGDGDTYATIPLIRPYAHGGFSLAAAPRCWHERDAEEAALYEAAEARRIAYVAATRARGLLVVSRYLPKAGVGTWGLLDAGLDGVRPLEQLVAAAADPPPRPHHPLHDGGARRRAALASAARPSFVARTASDNGSAARAAASSIDTGGYQEVEAGYGSAYGTAVHRLFEWAVRHRHGGPQAASERALAERLWDELGVQVPVEHGLRALAELRASALWRRILTADEAHAEVAIAGRLATETDGGESHPTAETAVWRGTIDLAYRNRDGWHLVDYKTHGDAAAEALADRAVRHEHQLAVYAALWEAATGVPPASRSIWFTETGAEHEI